MLLANPSYLLEAEKADIGDCAYRQTVYYVLRGAVRVLFWEGRSLPSDHTIEEHLIGVADPGNRIVIESIASKFIERTDAERSYSTVDGRLEVVGEFSAPVLINFSAAVLGEVSPFFVETATPCDVLCIPQERMGNVDDRRMVREDCINSLVQFVPVLRNVDVCGAIFPPVFQFDFIREMDWGSFVKRYGRPVVLPVGDALQFGAQPLPSTVYLISSGDVDGHTSSCPCIWPEFHVAYFACCAASAKVIRIVKGYRFERSALLNYLVRCLSLSQLRKIGEAASASLTAKGFGRMPVQQSFDREEDIPTAAFAAFRGLNCHNLSHTDRMALIYPSRAAEQRRMGDETGDTSVEAKFTPPEKKLKTFGKMRPKPPLRGVSDSQMRPSSVTMSSSVHLEGSVSSKAPSVSGSPGSLAATLLSARTSKARGSSVFSRSRERSAASEGQERIL
jgi:hypothetical protein